MTTTSTGSDETRCFRSALKALSDGAELKPSSVVRPPVLALLFMTDTDDSSSSLKVRMYSNADDTSFLFFQF
jgi:hypothetical protein